MADEKASYPKPLLVIKPDLQINDLYDISDLEELETELKLFTKEDLKQAIIQAQLEINEELYQLHQESLQNIPARNFKMAEAQENDADVVSKMAAVKNYSHKLEKSATKSVQIAEFQDDDGEDENSSDNSTEGEEEDTEEEEEDEVEEVKNLVTKMMREPIQKNTETRVKKPELREEKNENVEHLNSSVRKINHTFSQLFECLDVNRNLVGQQDPGEMDKSSRRSKEFNARFNRSLYQAEKELAGQKNGLNRGFLNTGLKTADCSRLKQLTRSCFNLLNNCLAFVPLAGSCPPFPSRFMDLLELMVETGSLLSKVNVNLLDFATNLRKVETLHSQYTERQLQAKSDILKSSSRTKGTSNTPRAEERTASMRTPKPRGNLLLSQRSNLARTKRMGLEENKALKHSLSPLRSEKVDISSLDGSCRSFQGQNLQQNNRNNKLTPSSHENPQTSRRKSTSLVEEFDSFVASTLDEGGDQERDRGSQVLRRLHRLELLATRESCSSESKENDASFAPGISSKKDIDLSDMLTKLDIIDSDFNLLHHKYQNN